MGARDRLRRLQKPLRGTLEPISLRDGSVAYIDPQQAQKDVFSHYFDSLDADFAREPRPALPHCLEVVAEAKDRARALEIVTGGSEFLAVEREALVPRGEFVPDSFIAGQEYGNFEGLEDLSE